MARVLCAYSGVEFKCDYFSIYLTEREYYHPIFTLSAPELLSLSDSYLQYKWTPVENYLYYLALFNSTELIEFRVPAVMTPTTGSIVAQNMESLLSIVDRIIQSGQERVRHVLNLNRIIISPDTKDLSNSKYWLENWHHTYDDYLTGYKTSTQLEKLSKKESILEKLIKDRTKNVSSYAAQLAEWAALAAGFDTDTQIVADGTDNDRPIQLRDYWKKLIIKCTRDDAVFNIHEGDLSELIDHCEDTIDHGSIQAHTLMAVLRSAQKKKKNFIDLGDIDVGSHGTVFRILDADASVEDANKLALIDSAPLSEPKQSDYPNKLAYLKAKMKWDMAEQYRKSEEARSKIEAATQLAQDLAATPLNRRSTDVSTNTDTNTK